MAKASPRPLRSCPRWPRIDRRPRYYLEARLDHFATPLAKAQLGAALALYGDRTLGTAFAGAVDALNAEEQRFAYRVDYGSRLRDTAAILALAAEFTPTGVDLPALAARLAELRDAARWTSTQEDAWTLIAASALAREAQDGSVTVDGEALTGSVYRRYMQEDFDAGTVTITNTGNAPTEIKVSVTAIPSEPPAAVSEGFTLDRAYYLLDGTPADLSSVMQNDRFVVQLTMSADNLGSGQYVVADPLPAGFEIENPNLADGAGTADLSWLSLNYPPARGIADRPVYRRLPLHVQARGHVLCCLPGSRRLARLLRDAWRDHRGHVPARVARQY